MRSVGRRQSALELWVSSIVSLNSSVAEPAPTAPTVPTAAPGVKKMPRESKEATPTPSREPQPASPSQSPDLTNLIVPSLQVGAGAGLLGVFVGAVVGIARSTPVGFSSAFAGTQWFTLGTSYYASRQLAIRTWWGDQEGELGQPDKIKASAFAGGSAGLIGGLLRGPRSALPGMIVFSLLGAGGQAAVNAAVGTGSSDRSTTGWLDSKWSPVTRLSDDEYSGMLQDKILRLDAEIALVDEAILALRQSKRSLSDGEGGSNTTKSN